MNPILFHVQSLFGSGHLNRICRIADFLSSRGYGVVLLSGGIGKPALSDHGAHSVALPGIRSDATFRNLFDENDNPVTPALFDERASLIHQTIRKYRPSMVITEGFPFARRRFAQEIMTLIREAGAAKGRPVPIVCSVRDVIQPKSGPDREQEILDIIGEHYDWILIHGDQDFLPFETTFRKFSHVRDKAVYTGYLDVSCERESPGNVQRSDTVTVSAGSGIVGRTVYLTAMEAARMTSGTRYRWRVLVGGAVAEEEFLNWKRSAPSNMIVERNRSDFREILSASMVSVSQCGYNTAVDLMSTRTPGIVVPYSGQGEVEQRTRASAMERSGHVRLIREDALTPGSLIRNIQMWRQDAAVPAAPASLAGNEKLLEFVRDRIGLTA